MVAVDDARGVDDARYKSTGGIPLASDVIAVKAHTDIEATNLEVTPRDEAHAA
jgi:hypothetical protein